MSYQEQIPRKPVNRREMLKRVARFSKVKGTDGGLPDSRLSGSERILYNVIGFQPPAIEEGAMMSPVGDHAARMTAIKISEGFSMGFCRALPGKGPLMHNHDTNETFIAINGTWRASWEDMRGKVQSVDLAPLDVISFPPGVLRRFHNVTRGSKTRYSTLMFVIAGDAPSAEFSTEAMAMLAAAGLSEASSRKRGKIYSTDSVAPAAKPAARKAKAKAKATARPAKVATRARKVAAKPAAAPVRRKTTAVAKKATVKTTRKVARKAPASKVTRRRAA